MDINFLKGIAIAHRGRFNHKEGIPENSLPAFQKALEENCPIECDVHKIKDGSIVVFHDDNLKRMTGIDKPLKECTYDELQKIPLLNTEYHIPLFQEVLSLINGKVLIDIELKYDQKVGVLEKTLCELLDHYKGPFVVKSFHPGSVLWFRIHRKNYIRGQLATTYKNDKNRKIYYKILSSMWFHCLTKPHFIAYDKDGIKRKRILHLRSKNIPIIAWVIKNEKELALVKPYADSILFDQEKIEISKHKR